MRKWISQVGKQETAVLTARVLGSTVGMTALTLVVGAPSKWILNK